jgi:RNA polymerase sigma-70 factor (ECF subfamily)
MAETRKADPRSDEELVRLCNEGDADSAARAFEALYRRHKEYVLRVALRFVHDRELALDVLQETFGYLLGKFPPTGDGLTLTAELRSLLYPVAKHNALTLRRKAERFPADEHHGDPDELAASAAPSSGDIARVLGRLPEERREVILLRFVDGLSLEDTAVALGIPLGTVKSRLHLALKQLREAPEIKDLQIP